MSTNLLIPQARDTRICGVWGREPAWEEGSIDLWRGRIVHEPMGSLQFSYYESQACLEKSRVSLDPRTTSWLDNDLFFCQTTGAWLAFSASIPSCLSFEATLCPWRWEDDLEPTPGQAAQFSISKPQCGCCCLLHILVIDSGEERRRTRPVESCVVEETGGTTTWGKIL